MTRRRRRHRRSSTKVIILILILTLISLSIILASRFTDFNIHTITDSLSRLPENIMRLFSKPISATETTEDPVPTQVPEPIYYPVDAMPTPLLEPTVVVSEISFAVEGTRFSGTTYDLFGKNDILYVKLSEFATFLGSDMSKNPSGEQFSFSYRGKNVVFMSNMAKMLLDDKMIRLPKAAIPFNRGNDLYIPAGAILEAFYPAHYANEDGIVNYSDFSRDFPLQENREIPIISYYAVTDDQAMAEYLVSNEWVSPDDFEEQLKYIQDNGFTTITFEDLADLANISKPVMLTFDGCWKDLYTVVYPRIQQYNTKINIFVWPDYLGTGGHITEEQLKEMATSDLVSVNAGIEVYKPTDSVKQDELFASIDKAKKYVTELVGHEPLAFAYPVGGITAGVQQHCSSEFRFCVRRSAERPYNTTIDDGSIIYRYTIQRGTPVAMLAYWLSRSN